MRLQSLMFLRRSFLRELLLVRCDNLKMLRAIKNQLTEAQKQSDLISKTAQIAAWTALTTAAAHPSGNNPYQKLRTLVSELETRNGSKTSENGPGSSESS